jgi:hypothetical protein
VKSPADPVEALRARPVSTLRAVTETPGIAASEESVTVPLIEPVALWPRAMGAKAMAIRRPEAKRFIEDFLSSSPLRGSRRRTPSRIVSSRV